MSEENAAGPKAQWFLSVQSVVLGLLLLGPLALPLLWISPKFKPVTKIWVTLLTLALTWLTVQYSISTFEKLKQQLAELKQSGLLP